MSVCGICTIISCIVLLLLDSNIMTSLIMLNVSLKYYASCNTLN